MIVQYLFGFGEESLGAGTLLLTLHVLELRKGENSQIDEKLVGQTQTIPFRAPCRPPSVQTF